MADVEAKWFSFMPGDVVLCATGNKWGIFKPLFKWLVGEFGHAMLYVFEKDGMPYFVEARPKKGVSIVGGGNYRGTHIKILRLKDNAPYYGVLAASDAKERAFDPSTLYGFADIVSCVVKLFSQKLGKPIKAWRPNKWVICSELVWECYGMAGIDLDVGPGIPLPADFATCPQLESIFEGELVV